MHASVSSARRWAIVVEPAPSAREEAHLKRFRHVLVLASLACLVLPVNAQRTSPDALADRPSVIRAAREVMQKARYCAFVTLGEDGQPQARVVDPLGPDDDMTVWVGTNPKTRKVAQVGKDSRVTLFYFDAAAPAYVTLIGTAVVSSDPAEKAKHWKNEWSPFYKDQHRGSDFVLLKFKPRRLEIVSQNHGLLNAPVTWRPVTIEFPEGVVNPPPGR